LTGVPGIPYLLYVRSSLHRPLVLGHRGYRARFPENTLLAFREALAAGADGIECDLQKSADGRYVIIHDPSTDRVTGSRLDVGRSTSMELRALDAGRGERLPFVEEMLAALPRDAYLDLELKEETLLPEDADRIAEILDAHMPRERLMISSFALRLLVPFRKKGFTVGLLVGEETAGRGLGGLAFDLFRLRPQFVNLPVDVLGILGSRRSALLFRILRVLGFSLLFWTVNRTEDAAALAPHARILVTDEVDTILGAVRPRKETDS
jgi:glycerophosphoryl diester phosphodiesterase